MQRWQDQQSGFTLVEVIVGVAILTIAGGAVMLLTVSGLQDYKRADNIQKVHTNVARIQSWIENEQTCRLAFRGPEVFDTAGNDDLRAGPFQIVVPEPVPVSQRGRFLPPDPSDKGAPVEVWDVRLEPVSGSFDIPNSLVVVKLSVNFSARNPDVDDPNQAKNVSGQQVIRSSKNSGATAGQEISFSMLTGAANRLKTCGPLTFASYEYIFNGVTTRDFLPDAACGNSDYAPSSTDGIRIRCIRIRCNGSKPNPAFYNSDGIICPP